MMPCRIRATCVTYRFEDEVHSALEREREHDGQGFDTTSSMHETMHTACVKVLSGTAVSEGVR